MGKTITTIRWLGVAGVEVTVDRETVLLDPYFSRFSKWRLLGTRLTPDEKAITTYLHTLPGRLTAVICGHTHFDHAVDVPAIASRAGCPIIGSRSLDTLLVLSGQPNRVTRCQPKTPIAISENITLEMIPSAHGKVLLGRDPFPGDIFAGQTPPLKMTAYRAGTVYMPKITIDSTVFVHAGSAGLDMAALQGEACDVLFMCVPGWKKVPAYTTEMLRQLQPRLVIPFHFDDFTRPLGGSGKTPLLPFTNLAGFASTVAQTLPNASVRIPKPLATITI